MSHFSYVIQPHNHSRYTELFGMALEHGAYEQLFAAVAYVRDGGVTAVDDLFSAHDRAWWAGISKRWLVAIDWCRSDPSALESLAGRDGGLRNSRLKVHDGAAVVLRRGCVPRRPFHPKLF